MKINTQRLLVIVLAIVLVAAVGYFQEGQLPIELLQELVSGSDVVAPLDAADEMERPPVSEAAAGKEARSREIIYRFASQQLFDSHFEKHGQEFGNITQEEYLEQVNALVQSSVEDVLTKTRSNGDVMYYRESTNEFAVKSARDVIKTYFRPSDGIDYYHRQH